MSESADRHRPRTAYRVRIVDRERPKRFVIIYDYRRVSEHFRIVSVLLDIRRAIIFTLRQTIYRFSENGPEKHKGREFPLARGTEF